MNDARCEKLGSRTCSASHYYFYYNLLKVVVRRDGFKKTRCLTLSLSVCALSPHPFCRLPTLFYFLSVSFVFFVFFVFLAFFCFFSDLDTFSFFAGRLGGVAHVMPSMCGPAESSVLAVVEATPIIRSKVAPKANFNAKCFIALIIKFFECKVTECKKGVQSPAFSKKSGYRVKCFSFILPY